MSTPKKSAPTEFAELMVRGANDAFKQMQKSSSRADTNHYYGRLLGMQWAASAYLAANRAIIKKTELVWLDSCGLLSAMIELERERAELRLHPKQAEGSQA